MNIEVIFHYYVDANITPRCGRNTESNTFLFDAVMSFAYAYDVRDPILATMVDFGSGTISSDDHDFYLRIIEDPDTNWPYRATDPRRQFMQDELNSYLDKWVHHIDVNGVAFKDRYTATLYINYLLEHNFKRPDWRAMRRLRRIGRKRASF